MKDANNFFPIYHNGRDNKLIDNMNTITNIMYGNHKVHQGANQTMTQNVIW